MAFTRGFALVAFAAFAFVALAPIGASIATVFLFAGPHNWFEARYFLRRLPPRWAAMRGYLSLGAVGVFGLTAAFAALPWLADGDGLGGEPWTADEWDAGMAGWNLALVGWVATLALVRRPMSPARRWPWLVPLVVVVAAAAWWLPRAWDVALVYAHPLVALVFLDRELAKRSAAAQAAYRRVLPLVPILALLLIGITADSPPLGGRDVLTARIVEHAGSDVFAVVSDRCPVALHVFLETIHYAVWIVFVPWAALRAKPWQVGDIPLAHGSHAWRRAVGGLLAVGVVVALVLWCGFLIDYPLTRDVYFTVAMLHVLAEIPFLIRLL
jgi:hypothetical protein